MPIQHHELIRYEAAATRLCQLLGESPYEPRINANGSFYPLWMDYAEKMAEHCLMLRVMKDLGVAP